MHLNSEIQNLRYFAHDQDMEFFFTENLKDTTDKLRSKLDDTSSIWLYPDATLKANGLPTGLLYFSKPQDFMLLPFVLRDPGCGFLTFKLNHTSNFSVKDLNAFLNDALADIHSSPFKTIFKENKNEILAQGLMGIKNQIQDKLDNFNHTEFCLDNSINLTPEELELLESDFLTLTNTLEIRQIFSTTSENFLKKSSLHKNDYVGFIHSGSAAFPKILANKFVYKIAEFAHQNNLFSLDEIEKGIFGVPLNTSIGKEYYNTLKAAMNYALVSRYCIYLYIKDKLEKEFSKCSLTLLDDTLHAGVFSKQYDNKKMLCGTRGVQSLASQKIHLLAGQRETIAALIKRGPSADQLFNFVAHGTGYVIRDNYNYQQHFDNDEKNLYLDFANKAFYNTNANINECLPYTFNLLRSLNYLNEIGLIEPLAFLSPVINIHSEISLR